MDRLDKLCQPARACSPAASEKDRSPVGPLWVRRLASSQLPTRKPEVAKRMGRREAVLMLPREESSFCL